MISPISAELDSAKAAVGQKAPLTNDRLSRAQKHLVDRALALAAKLDHRSVAFDRRARRRAIRHSRKRGRRRASDHQWFAALFLEENRDVADHVGSYFAKASDVATSREPVTGKCDACWKSFSAALGPIVD